MYPGNRYFGLNTEVTEVTKDRFVPSATSVPSVFNSGLLRWREI
jgi:hypothetical protein